MKKNAGRTLLAKCISAFSRGPLHWVAFGLVLLGGAFLRFFRLSTQSFWDDEVATFTVAVLDPSMIWALIGNIDFNPPLYYLVLHYWMKLGDGEFALRSLSALLGLLSIVLTYKLGRLIIGRCTGLLAAGLFAVSPLGIYCAQETRYNMLLTALTLGSLIFLLRLLQKGRWYYAAGFSACVAMMIYTHYYSFFVIAAYCAYLGVLFGVQVAKIKRNNDGISRPYKFTVFHSDEGNKSSKPANTLAMVKSAKQTLWNISKAVVSICLAFAAFLPFVKYFIKQLSRGIPGREMTDIGSIFKKILIYLFAGHSPVFLPTISNQFESCFESSPRLHQWVLIAAVFPIYAAILFGYRSREMRHKGLLYCALAVPIVLILLFALRMPLFDPRYVMLLVPFACVAAGAGIARVIGYRPVIGIVLVAYVILLSAISLKDYYFKPKFWRQDWRGIARELEAATTEKDAICFYNYYTSLAFNHYYEGDAPFVYLFNVEDRYGPAKTRISKMERLLEEVSTHFQNIWLVDYHGIHDDPYDMARKKMATLEYRRLSKKCRMTGLYGFCVERYSKNLENIYAAYSKSIDFSAGNPNELQLLEGFYSGNEAWRWIGKCAKVALPMPEIDYQISVSFYANYKYLGQKPFDVFLMVNGSSVGKIRVDSSNVFVIESSVLKPEEKKRDIVVEIESEKTFVPNTILKDGDTSQKSLLVNRIEIIEVPVGGGG